MGKRRVRNLKALGQEAVAGFDLRRDRRDEAAARYGIRCFESYEAALSAFKPEALVISTGPRHHMDYALPAAQAGIHCFIEASVVDAERVAELGRRTRNGKPVMAPSCTMRFFPGPRKIKELLRSGVIGRSLNFNYQTGQYLPDWHPWERIQDYYVSQRDTGGCREIVPFELTWLNDLFGEPEALACVRAKLSDLEADIDDIYHCLLRYPGPLLGSLTVEVLSRPAASREMRILGSEGELVYSADENCVRYASTTQREWVRIGLGQGTVEAGYINPEEPYVAELRAFIEAATQGAPALFPNTLEDDVRVLRTLDRLDALGAKPS
jgi:predicted dehydrogenase